MDFTSALREAAREAGWSDTRVAAVAGVSEGAIRKLYRSEIKTLKHDATLALMRQLPGFAERLGFRAVTHAA